MRLMGVRISPVGPNKPMAQTTKILILEEKVPLTSSKIKNYTVDDLSPSWSHFSKIKEIHKSFNLIEICVEDIVMDKTESNSPITCTRRVYGIFSDPKEAFRFALSWNNNVNKSNFT